MQDVMAQPVDAPEAPKSSGSQSQVGVSMGGSQK